ncbi:MAG: hypothetical protein ABI375_00395 [Rudaea sp.]
MNLPTYIVRSILRPVGKGVTNPFFCTLDGVIKFDCDESPYAVYNELVAQRIGERVGAPIAAGGITISPRGEAFASLRSGAPGLSLPDLQMRQVKKVARMYPDETAALIVFDVFIGNWDRTSNVKAATISPNLKLFAAFDHGHALLAADRKLAESIRRLGLPDPIVTQHPFSEVVDRSLVQVAADRVRRLTDSDLNGCCILGMPFRSVSTRVQGRLAAALKVRRENIDMLLKAVLR